MKIVKGLQILLIVLLVSACVKTKQDYYWVDVALANAEKQALLMAGYIEQFPDKLPRSTNKNGEIVLSGSDWWCSGFFPGTLWYLYDNSKNEELLHYASEYTNRISKEQFNTTTHDLGFMLYCSYGNALRITGEDSINNVLINGSNSLATRFNEVVGCIQSWEGGEKWKFPVIIDNMMNLEMLMWAYKTSGDEKFNTISLSHANKTIDNHFRPDYSSYHVLSFNPENGAIEFKGTDQGYNDDSAWARGQAWGLYGFTMMFRETGDSMYLAQAQRIADFILTHKNLPEHKIPYWDFDSPAIPDDYYDSSSAAIIASALLELSTFVDDDAKSRYFSVAEKQLKTLASNQFTAEVGTNGFFILKHGVGNFPQNSEIDAPLSYGDYYYVEALTRYKKLIK